MDISEQKSTLRTSMSALRAKEYLEGGVKASTDLATRLVSLPAVKHAHCIGVYSAYGTELDLGLSVRRLRENIPALVVAFPLVVSETAMVFASFSPDDDMRVLEDPRVLVTNIDPERIVDPAAFDILLVPGLAFDGHGNRLGQGSGYYDRYLPRVSTNASVIGIAYDGQVLDEVPVDEHDMRVHYILTPTRLITAG